MATYAIGDVQGCLTELTTLLETCSFDSAHDRLWFVGDLVNRGPASLEVLRFVKSLGETAVVVLGNHDLHLLCVAEGFAKSRPDDTLGEILGATDRDELLEWLRGRKLLHAEGETILVHAGLLPQWTIPEALALAQEVEANLRGPGYRECLAKLYGSEPREWNDRLSGPDRIRVIVNAMTRMRFCTESGEMEFRAKGSLDAAPPGFRAWFDISSRKSSDATIVCGHWSALGLRVQPGLVALDSGCIWGGALSAYRIDDHEVFKVPCAAYPAAGDG
jgi:bis(5'-nucleosyl)-tetraphosphatase (symmetrical)